jgi:hypothetical protein
VQTAGSEACKRFQPSSLAQLVLGVLTLAGCGSTPSAPLEPSATSTPPTSWDFVTMASGQYGDGTATTIVAAGRGDGVYRVYNNGISQPASQASGAWDHVLNEFSYANGAWTGTSLGGVPDPVPSHSSGFEVFFATAARGDGKSRVYAINNGWCDSSGCSPWIEFDYTNGSWLRQTIDYSGRTSIRSASAASGHVKSGSFSSFYYDILDFFSEPEYVHHVRELRFQARTWVRSELDRFPVDPENQQVRAVVVGSGRHDDSDRLYLLVGRQQPFGPLETDVVEYANAGGPGWERSVIAHVTLPYGSDWSFSGMFPARGGRSALYLVTGDGDFHEFFFDGGQWRHSVVARLLGLGGGQTCAGGDGRNDGVYRLYCTSGGTELRELTLQGDTWVVTDAFDATSGRLFVVSGMAVGPGRNDGHQRIYIQRTQLSLFGVGGQLELVELTYRR